MKRRNIMYVAILIALPYYSSAFMSRLNVKADVPADDTVTVKSLSNLPSHPYLFADKIKLDKVKAQHDDVTNRLREIVILRANAYLLAPDLIYPTGELKLDAMRTLQGRILYLGLAYRLSSDTKYFTKARKELLQLSAMKNWGTNHFLDVGEAALAAAVGLDWFNDILTQGDRELIQNAIINNALLPSLEVKEGKGSWVTGDFNWAQVCHCGLVTGALAIAGKNPQLACKLSTEE